MKSIKSILIFGIVFQSCITFKHSALRKHNVDPVEIENCKISSTGAVYMNWGGIIKADFMPAGIKIEMDDILIYADPLVVDDATKANYIYITHSHLDHFSKSDVRKLSTQETIIIGPKTVTKKIKDCPFKTAVVGEKFDFGRIKCEVVESYNINSKIHKPGSKYVGYVLTCDKVKIYIAGDTDFIPEMEELENITVAIIPIGTGKTAMDPLSAAKAANLIKPKIVIPVHYKMGLDKEKEFLENVDNDIEVKFIQ
ncbi:MBL fold metallo-hydrolase [Bacteroidota bacterium]